MGVVYLVRGHLTPTSKEKIIFYNGRSPKEAFDFFDKYSKKAEIVVGVYENGYLVREFKQ